MIFFFFNDTATTEIYTLSLHDALPILCRAPVRLVRAAARGRPRDPPRRAARSRQRGRPPGARLARRGGSLRRRDRKSTRLNSSHANISYAVFCLKKKKNQHVTYASAVA